MGTTDWTPADGESRTFKFRYELSSSAPDTVQGDGASATFSWEAQSS